MPGVEVDTIGVFNHDLPSIAGENIENKYNLMQGQPVGLVQGKKMICITSRGGDYSPGTPFHAHDFQEPYLRAIFGFIGITDIESSTLSR